ncbi:MAG TPA: endolytic transglycosylase MltG [Candidatus Limnocylindria bacterium]|nr:endolytic transglycosylase MltG [Candidatus Limnocylindria bacterium]
MSRRPGRSDLDERRNARIRQLREQRDGPMRRRRRLQPVVLLAWFAAVAAVAAIVIFLGFLAFAPKLMAWVEENPGSVEHGVVRDFVQWYRPGELSNAAKGGDERITVTVAPGATDGQIGHLLFQKGLISSELAFQYAVMQAGRSGTLQAGTYDLTPSLKPSEIVAALKQESGPEISIRIGEGWRLEQIVSYLATTKSTMNIDEFAQLVKDPPADLLAKYDFFANLPVGRTLEGYLYPDTYSIFANATAREVVETLLNRFEEQLTPEILDGIASQDLTVDEAVTIASIVEREAVLDKERPLIAGVYINRIQHPDNGQTNGLLNADPTLQYGLDTAEHGSAPVDEWGGIKWWQPLPDAGGKVELPEALAGYQTYLNPGLPPSPIAAPRASSLAAVAAPEGDNLYFVAGCPNGERDGSHYFAKTNAQHEANKAKANGECPAV